MDRMDEAIFEFAYIMAMRDATQQRAFLATNKKLFWQAHSDKGKESRLQQLREGIKNPLRNYIDKILDNDVEVKELPDFYKVAYEIQRATNEFVKEADMKLPPKEGEQADEKLAVFSFGNTQKLINMTAKYMFMATYGRPDLRERFDQCHCPMDGIIVEKIIKMLDGREDIRKKCGLTGGWKTKLRTPTWSNIKEPDEGYEQFQEIVDSLGRDPAIIKELGATKPLYPLEFDFYAWGQ